MQTILGAVVGSDRIGRMPSHADRVFDRRPQFDERSKRYGIRGFLAQSTQVLGRKVRSYTWKHVQLDQGSEGACTGFATTMEAAARPLPVFGDPARFHVQSKYSIPLLNDIARSVYHRARQLDEWPGEAYEGSSVIAAVQAGVEKGWWGGYRWALGPGPENAAADVIAALGHHGPVIMGTYWYEAMMRPRGDGQLVVAGQPVGGHAYLLTAYNAKRDAVWTPNSWGGAGQGWISRTDLITLLANDGEGCIVTQRKGHG